MSARAFAGDPLFRAMFPDPDRHEAALSAWMAIGTRNAQLDGVVDTTAEMGAVALWFPPGYRQRLSTALRMSGSSMLMLRYASPAELRAGMQWVQRWSRKRAALASGSHWYLEELAVEPGRQRSGLGAVLLLHGLQRADHDRVPVFLETWIERNVALYRKAGFDVVEYTPPEDEPLHQPVWRMLRPPA